MRIGKKYYTLGLGLITRPTDESIRDTIIKDGEESFKSIPKEEKDILWSHILWMVIIGVVISAIGIFIVIDQYIKQKHIDSGTPYIRGVTPSGYLVETIKLKDGTTWDVLCIDGVKTIYDIDKRLISDTNLACF